MQWGQVATIAALAVSVIATLAVALHRLGAVERNQRREGDSRERQGKRLGAIEKMLAAELARIDERLAALEPSRPARRRPTLSAFAPPPDDDEDTGRHHG